MCGLRRRRGKLAGAADRPFPKQELAMPTKRSFFATLAAIAWSFVGLRRKRDFDVDADGAFNPVYVIVAALLGVAVFIGLLRLAVHLAVS